MMGTSSRTSWLKVGAAGEGGVGWVGVMRGGLYTVALLELL